MSFSERPGSGPSRGPLPPPAPLGWRRALRTPTLPPAPQTTEPRTGLEPFVGVGVYRSSLVVSSKMLQKEPSEGTALLAHTEGTASVAAMGDGEGAEVSSMAWHPASLKRPRESSTFTARPPPLLRRDTLSVQQMGPNGDLALHGMREEVRWEPAPGDWEMSWHPQPPSSTPFECGASCRLEEVVEGAETLTPYDCEIHPLRRGHEPEE